MAYLDITALDPEKTIVVATGNAHKVIEIEEILGRVLPDVRFVALGELGDYPDAVEDGETFADNALIKARYALECTGLKMAVADDSGLCVDALGGAPGVWSARWAGVHAADDANNEKLMREMADVPEGKRTARFHSSVVLAYADGSSLVGEGDCEGRIGYDPVGTNGFGYDPLFLPDDTPGRTMAQLELAEKNTISHRYHALIDLSAKLTRG
jgi:XTP/dITP diphosphohydrolase